MKKYCCKELHDLEDDSWQRGFGVNVIEKNKVEIFCMDDAGYPKRIDAYIFNFCPFCGSNLSLTDETAHIQTTT
jgi:hypothetical protein